MNFENIEQIYKHLIGGGRIKPVGYNSNFGLIEGNLIDGSGQWVSLDFQIPSAWSIYEAPKWYENIPAGGALCWVKIAAMKPYVVLVTGHDKRRGFIFASGGCWSHVTPLTKDEIQSFLDNAPDATE